MSMMEEEGAGIGSRIRSEGKAEVEGLGSS